MPPLTLKSLTHYSRTTTWTGNGTYQYEASEILWSLTAYTRRRSPALTPFSLSTNCPTDAHTCMLPCIMLSPLRLSIVLAFYKDLTVWRCQCGLVHVQLEACEYMDGIQQLLEELLDEGVHMHAMSNYPVWYQDINAKLRIDRCEARLCCQIATSGCCAVPAGVVRLSAC